MSFEFSIMNFEFLSVLPWDSISGWDYNSKFKIQNSKFEHARR